MATPRVSFGMIVLNGEPFLRYNLRALYPYAHQILIVEGACRAASCISTPGGHSIDSSLETLRQFQMDEDPEKKVEVILRDGFWSEKDEQSQAYANRATGDYLWQVDVDEFYKPHDMEEILRMLEEDHEITAISFPQIQFWGDFDFYCDGYILRRGLGIFHRLFKWGPNFRYVTHRPPTVNDSNGRDLRTLKWIQAQDLEKRGIFLYHYSLLFPKQVREKCQYYKNVVWVERSEAMEWFQDTYLELGHPYRVHNVYQHISWLERFRGSHPRQIEALQDDIRKKRVKVDFRTTADIEDLLMSFRYRCGKQLVKWWEPVDRYLIPRLYPYLRYLRHPSQAFDMFQQKVIRWVKEGRGKKVN